MSLRLYGLCPLLVSCFSALLFLSAPVWGTATYSLPSSGADATVLAATRPDYLRERDERLDIETVIQRARDGDFQPMQGRPRSLGIGARPVWFHLRVHNPGDQPRSLHLLAGATWIDRIDVHRVREGRPIGHQIAGDGDPQWQNPLPGQGYDFRQRFAPGTTDLFIRAETPDPLLMPVQLHTPESLSGLAKRTRYNYGFIYGFLLALLLYNALLYFGLRLGEYRDYSLYLACFLLMNLAYTGHGYEWLWSGSAGIQAYMILVAMVLFAVAGLRFTATFLNLAWHAPRLTRALYGACLAAVALMAAAVGLDLQREAALLAFTVVLLAFAVMLILGCVALWRGFTAARYFLLAVISGIAGTLITTLTVWGWIPYSAAGFRAVEFGLLIEATLLALAVAYRVRANERARERAEELARVDPLTGLLNRRALMEQGEGLMQMSRRGGGELALILLDLDHFKRINDVHGHALGDQALITIAGALRSVCRRGDLAARWGGEEFILLLPGAGLDEARAVAERMRTELAARPVENHRDDPIELRASFGIAVLNHHTDLEELINEADAWLYQAKADGRNRVRFSTA